MRRVVLSFNLVILLLLAASPPSAQAVLLYEQPSTISGFNAWASVEGQDGSGASRTYDNFHAASDWLVDGLEWKGLYRDVAVPSNNPVSPTTTSWEVAFHEDAAGEPGTLIDSRVITAGDVTNAFLGFAPLGGDSVPVYSFELRPNTPFALPGGTTYWLSVQSHAPTSDDRWAWFSGTGGDGDSAQDRFDGTRITRPLDRTFKLFGEAVPEPSCLTLLLFGCILTLLRRRRSLC